MRPEQVLWELFVIFVAARVAGEIAARLGQPPVVGELAAGVAVGPHALGWVHEGEVLTAVAEIGVVFLLFEVGLENRLSDFRRVGGTAVAVAVSGVAVPFAAGFATFAALGHRGPESLFVGAALVATSVAVTARVLGELRALQTPVARVVLGAAVIDDVLGLLVLAAVSGAAAGNLEGARLGVLVGEAVFFLGFVALVGTRLVRRHASLLGRLRLADGPFAVGVAICLGLSALAGRIGLAAIVGAFLAGVVLAETREQFELEKRVQPLVGFFAPFFFVHTGMAVQPRGLAGAWALAAGLTALALLTKLAPCALVAASLGRRQALAVGMGMVPRGEVGIIVASIGLGANVVSPAVYAVVVAMAIATTLLAPPLLRRLVRA